MDMIESHAHKSIDMEAYWFEPLMRLEQKVEQRLLVWCEPAVYKSLKKELVQIQDALDRIKIGSFGQCQSCPASINANRLAFIPYAELCFSCQRSKEKEENGRTQQDNRLTAGQTPPNFPNGRT